MKYYTVPEAAKELGVHDQTIRNWLRKGHLKAIQIAKGYYHRIPQSELDKYNEKIKFENENG